MMSSLVGNPHSASSSALNSAHRIENVRLKVLKLFEASPDAFDVVFVANATAGVKLVTDAFRGREDGFWYGYHRDSHTSLVGAREVATGGHYCFSSDASVLDWISDGTDSCPAGKTSTVGLFSYPGQSNMNGRRLPLDWPGELRRSGHKNVYSLLDAAGLVSTSPLDLSDAANAPDFTVLSFYKIFGFPDLGALIVRKQAGHVFDTRQYFGGGTVEMVSALDDPWHEKKESSIHARLEDGTLPIRNIMALECAMKVHKKLFGGLDQVSQHTAFLSKVLYNRLSSLEHSDGSPVCHIYKDPVSQYGDSTTQGGTVTFNLRDSHGNWRSVHEINKIAIVRNMHIRTGTLCNPGGMAASLNIDSTELRSYFAAGFRCGNENDVRGGKPIGMARASFGAMSTLEDVHKFADFIDEFFVEKSPPMPATRPYRSNVSRFAIESLTIYPIKSCGGWQVPEGVTWSVRPEGLAWDREWCLVHQGTRASLSQKRCPKMALLRPSLDLRSEKLKVKFEGSAEEELPSEIEIPLAHEANQFLVDPTELSCATNVCGDKVHPQIYASQEVTDFFSNHLNIPCHLAWLPSTASCLPHRVAKALSNTRKNSPNSKPYDLDSISIPGSFPTPPPSPPPRPLLLANESPILTISRASVEQLNKSAVSKEGRRPNIGPEAFRANIVLSPSSTGGPQEPFIEDSWHTMRLTRSESDRSRVRFDDARRPTTQLQVLGPCRRCQMVSVNQKTGERGQEPFVTLAKTRARDGAVWFGVHCGLDLAVLEGTLRVGDMVEGFS